MASTWNWLVGTYKYLFDDLSHPVTKDWALATNHIPLALLLVAYNVFCIKIGPMWMKNRKPFELKTTIKLYNIFQVFISVYIAYEGFLYIFTPPFNFKCYGVQDGEERIARAIWTYLLVKIIELLDTIFFVLRKSYRQVTFLHLYHHTAIPIISWIGLKYFPGGQGILIGALNSVVHIFMYTYYLIASFGPQYQKYLWWKKYVTIIQIIQFAILLLHGINSLFYSCSYHTSLKLVIILQSLFFFYLFSKFYYDNYIVKKEKRSKDSNGKSVNGYTGEISFKYGDDNNNGTKENYNRLDTNEKKYVSDRKDKDL